MKTCPNCSARVMNNVQMCDCGYDFNYMPKRLDYSVGKSAIEEDTTMISYEKYPALRLLSKLIRVVGWISLAMGVLLLLGAGVSFLASFQKNSGMAIVGFIT